MSSLGVLHNNTDIHPHVNTPNALMISLQCTDNTPLINCTSPNALHTRYTGFALKENLNIINRMDYSAKEGLTILWEPFNRDA